MEVPQYDNTYVSPSISPAPQARPTGASRQLSEMGGAAMDFGKHMENIQDMMNITRVQNAVSTARQAAQDLESNPETGFRNVTGENVLKKDDQNRSFNDVYSQKLNDTLGGIRADLTPAQQRMFDLHANEIKTQFHGALDEHVFHQSREFATSTWGAAAAQAEQDMAAAQSPDDVEKAKTNLHAAYSGLAMFTGKSTSEVDMQTKEGTSKALANSIKASLEDGNVSEGMSKAEKYKDQMLPQDWWGVQRSLNQQHDMQVGIDAQAHATRVNASGIRPTMWDRVTNFTQGSLNAESYDKVNALSQKYNKDVESVIAASTIGESKVDAAHDAAKQAGKPNSWQEYLQPEDKTAVNKLVDNFNNGVGRPDFPTKSKFVQDALDALPPNARPSAVESAKNQAERTYTMLEQSHKEQGENSVVSAQRLMAANNMTWDQLPASVKESVVNYAPDKVAELRKYGANVTRPAIARSDPELLSDLYMHPEKWSQADESQRNEWSTHLSPNDLKKVINGAKSQDNSVESLDRSFNTTLNNNLEQLKIPTQWKKGNTAAAERYSAIQSYAQDYLYQQQQAAGKKFKPQEIKQSLDELFSKDANFQREVLGFTVGGNKPLMSATVRDLTPAQKDSLRNSLRKKGINNPTDAQLMKEFYGSQNE